MLILEDLLVCLVEQFLLGVVQLIVFQVQSLEELENKLPKKTKLENTIYLRGEILDFCFSIFWFSFRCFMNDQFTVKFNLIE